MEARMSLQARRELLNRLRPRYRRADKNQKQKILDEFIEVTQYGRKHAIALLNKDVQQTDRPKGTGRKRKYDDSVKQVLIQIWRAANEICSKRLIPFLPDFLEALERTGRLDLTEEVRKKLLSMCPATADQLLSSERRVAGGRSTTRSGTLLKRQIPIRTFSDWNDIVPGFFEADLVAHCGVDVSGRFLNSLVMIDIATSWTECFALLQKGEAEVISAIKKAQDVLPMAILGFDSDNGSEFINHGVIDFCRENQITFTRSRAYKKNDQAHVEERNGSVVRRTVGYDRYEGIAARQALQQLYQCLRLYVNFFQPSMKLISKQRDGAKVSRQYDSAQTPYRRMLNAASVSNEAKSTLRLTYSKLDPVTLLKELEQAQDALWKHAWRQSASNDISQPDSPALSITIIPSAAEESSQLLTVRRSRNDKAPAVAVAAKVTEIEIGRKYRKTRKPRKPSKQHTWRTRKDPFENAIEEIETQFHRNPKITAKQLLSVLQKKFPGDFSEAQRRTLMRRLNKLRNLGDGATMPAPSRRTYPKHIKSRNKLSTEQWQQVTKEVKACFEMDQGISSRELLTKLQNKFPHIVSDAQVPTLRRRLNELRSAGAAAAIPHSLTARA
jgi:hypothetical protein